MKQVENIELGSISIDSSTSNVSRSIFPTDRESEEKEVDIPNRGIEVIASSISNECPKLDHILHFNVYSSKLFELLNQNGYRQIIEFVIDKIQLPLYNQDEDQVVSRVLENTIEPQLFEHIYNENNGYAAKAVGILVSFKDAYESAKIKKVQQLNDEMDNQVIMYVPFGKAIYFRKFKSIEKKVDQLGLSEDISQGDILGKAFYGIYKGQPGYSRWASSYLTNSTTLDTVHLLFTDLDDLKRKVKYVYKMTFIAFLRKTLPWIFVASAVCGALCFVGFLIILVYHYYNKSNPSSSDDSAHTYSVSYDYVTAMPTLPHYYPDGSNYFLTSDDSYIFYTTTYIEI